MWSPSAIWCGACFFGGGGGLVNIPPTQNCALDSLLEKLKKKKDF